MFGKKKDQEDKIIMKREEWECFRNLEDKKRIYNRYIELENILKS